MEKKDVKISYDLLSKVEKSLTHITDQTIIASSQIIENASVRPRGLGLCLKFIRKAIPIALIALKFYTVELISLSKNLEKRRELWKIFPKKDIRFKGICHTAQKKRRVFSIFKYIIISFHKFWLYLC